MKIIEDYVQRKIDENNREIIINLNKKGHSIEDIARIVGVNPDFVKKTLSKKKLRKNKEH